MIEMDFEREFHQAEVAIVWFSKHKDSCKESNRIKKMHCLKLGIGTNGSLRLR